MPTITKRSDTEITEAVTQELVWDPKVDHAGIGAKVLHGVVTLVGTTPTYASRIAAVDAAHRVAGVLDVADEIEVRLPNVRGDADLAQAVRRALTWDVFVPEQRVRSTVSNGWVTLEGEVEHLYQKEDAARIVKELAGVRGVSNAIVVKPNRVAPVEIERSIREALVRRAEHGAGHVAVSVSGSTVRLTGKADSWAERQAIEETARMAPGVSAVHDEIKIDPYS